MVSPELGQTLHELQIELVGRHLGAERENELPQNLVGQRWRFHIADLAIDPQERRCPRLEVEVGGILFHGELDQLIEVYEMLQNMTREPHVRLQSIRAARLSQETHAEAGVRLRGKDRSLGTPVQN